MPGNAAAQAQLKSPCPTASGLITDGRQVANTEIGHNRSNTDNGKVPENIMITLITPIKLNEQSDAVANLHAAIQAIGFSVAANEVRERRAGESTLKLVRAFQQQSKIAFDDKLLVDQATSGALTKVLAERGCLSPPRVMAPATPGATMFVIQGQILQKDGQPAAGLTTRALTRHKTTGATVLGEGGGDPRGG